MSKPSSGASSSSARSKGGPAPASPAGKGGAPKTRKSAKPVIPETPGPARIIAIANQKGGVGKSTTAVSLGAALADLGYHVLVVDLDPQGNASTGMGIRHEARAVTIYDVVVGEAPIDQAIVQTPVARLQAVPSTIDLAGAEIELVSQFSREGRLKRALATVQQDRYDFILLDCPPSLGLLTVNALTAAEELIVPIQCEYYALEGLGQLLRNVNLVQQNINPDLRLSGIVMTMFDPRTKLSEQVVSEVQRFFGDVMYDVIIPRTVRLSEAPGYGQPITVYDPKSKGAECYRLLAREVALRPPPEHPMPVFEELPMVVISASANGGAVAEGPLDEGSLEEIAIPTVHELAHETEAATAVAEVLEEELELEALHEEDAAVVESSLEEGVPGEVAADVSRGRGPEASTDAVTAPAPDEETIWEESDARDEPRVRPVRDLGRSAPSAERRVVVIDDSAEIVLTASPESPVGRQGPVAAESGTDEGPEIGAVLHDEETTEKRRWRLFRKGGE